MSGSITPAMRRTEVKRQCRTRLVCEEWKWIPYQGEGANKMFRRVMYRAQPVHAPPYGEGSKSGYTMVADIISQPLTPWMTSSPPPLQGASWGNHPIFMRRQHAISGQRWSNSIQTGSNGDMTNKKLGTWAPRTSKDF